MVLGINLRPYRYLSPNPQSWSCRKRRTGDGKRVPRTVAEFAEIELGEPRSSIGRDGRRRGRRSLPAASAQRSTVPRAKKAIGRDQAVMTRFPSNAWTT
jgi:hypothetical protein